MVYRSRQFGNDSAWPPESQIPDAPWTQRPGPRKAVCGYVFTGMCLEACDRPAYLDPDSILCRAAGDGP